MKAIRKAGGFITAILAAFLVAPPASAGSGLADKFVAATDSLHNPAIVYDASYRRIAYPNGDVPAGTGVCTDVVIRAYRAIGIDLQKLVHQDMAAHFRLYPHPARWRLPHPDSNIDHRRVPNLAVFFARHGKTLKITRDAKDYAPGDIVTWNLVPGGSVTHIGIVTDKRSMDGKRPVMMHNIGRGQVFEDVLFAYQITGHFRYGLD